MRNVENRRGLAAWSASSSSVTTPLPSTTRSRSAGSNSGSPKKSSPPAASRLTSARRITPGRRRRDAADALEVGLALVGGEVLDDRAQVLGVQQRQALLVGPVEDQPERGLLGVVEVEHLRQQDRAELGERGADRDRRALAAQREELDRVRRGRPVVAGVLGARLDLGRCPRRAWPCPERSPLTSASSTGTPASDSWPASPCSVLVLPVPVAPATRPCRLSVANGMRTLRVGIDLAVDDDGAELQRPALRRVPGSDLLWPAFAVF